MPMPNSSEPALAHLPIFLDLAGQPVLVVGAGAEAHGKIELLLKAGAAVTVLTAGEPCDDRIAAMADLLTLEDRAFTAADLAGQRLCIAALEDHEASRAVMESARAAGVLFNAVDKPALCDFIMPAIVERGPVTIAISTGGASPALARDLRARIEAAVPPAYGRLAAFCRRWRDAAAALPRTLRRRFWDEVLDGPIATAVLAGDDATGDRLIQANLAQPGAKSGSVSLVGAGPGDPDLLTLRAVRAIKRADVILYDKLVGDEVLALARRDARRIDVGKRCGRHSASQAAINELLLKHARAGDHVVRLKGGDPFIFGRGGEELEHLRLAGVPVEVVPGITAAIAAAARLGIPLTHRGMSRSLQLVTGHGLDDKEIELDWAALGHPETTVAVYMGSRSLGRLTGRMLAAGIDPATPAIAIENASLPSERTETAPVSEIAARVAAAGFTGPTLILVGRVVGLRAVAATEVEQAA